MPKLDRAGIFNAKPYGWTLRKPERSKAIILDLSFLVLEMEELTTSKWLDIRGCAYEVTGSMWILGNDGSRQDRTLETLIRVMGWTGDIDQFRIQTDQPGAWQPPPVQIKVEYREWTDKRGLKHATYEARWINPVGWKGQANEITETQLQSAKADLDAAGLAAAVAAIKSGKMPPVAAARPLPPMVTTPGMPPAIMPMPTMPPVPTVSPVPPPSPTNADYPPWAPPPSAPSSLPLPPGQPPGLVPFTGQF